MENIGLIKDLLFFFKEFGVIGIVAFLWWQGQRDIKSHQEMRDKEIKKWEDRFNEENRKWDMRFSEMKNMYENNVELVRGYEKVTGDQQGIILLNTQAWTKLTTIIESRGTLYEP